MRTPDGRFITYVWNGDYMADFHGDWRKDIDSFVSRLAYAYEKLSYKIGVDTAYIHTLRDIGNRAYMEKMAEYFPAVWHWTSNLYHENLLMDFAAYCKKNNRTFSQPVYPDYYGSKLYPIGKYNYNMYHFLRDVIALKIGDVEKDYYRMGVTDVYINYLERILKTDTPLVSFITYNDYPEGHHVAPELNHNFGFSVLFNHYKNIWMGNPQKNDREFAVLAYKKYKSSVVPYPFNIRVDAKSRRMHPQFPPESDDFINVVTFLKSPAEIIVNGEKIGTAKGEGKIEVFKTPLKKGKVRLEISRGGKMQSSLKALNGLPTNRIGLIESLIASVLSTIPTTVRFSAKTHRDILFNNMLRTRTERPFGNSAKASACGILTELSGWRVKIPRRRALNGNDGFAALCVAYLEQVLFFVLYFREASLFCRPPRYLLSGGTVEKNQFNPRNFLMLAAGASPIFSNSGVLDTHI